MNLVARLEDPDVPSSAYEQYSLADWLAHYEARAQSEGRRRLAYDERPLSESDAATLGPSIAQFQLGEISDGAYLIKGMTDYALKTGRDDLIPLAHKMVREARHHAYLLEQFMAHHDLPRVKRHPLDAAFRVIRRMGGVETMISTLMLAEVIASHYYQCLGHSTRSVMLKRIAADLREDERVHVHLYRMLLKDLRKNRRLNALRLTRFIERSVFFCALVAVWPYHHKVYRRAGTSLGAYWSVYWRLYRDATQGLGPEGHGPKGHGPEGQGPEGA